MHNIVLSARGKQLSLTRTRIMGILNCTPDSFSDGGKYLNTEAAVYHAKEMITSGADIIDIGGQSTRPYYVMISPEEEWDRIESIIRILLKETDAILSVDTFYPQVAEKALGAGVHIINDISGFQDLMMETVADSGCGCVVVYPRGVAAGEDILEATCKYFEERCAAAHRYGIIDSRLCFDPGIGFGKNPEDNLRLIANVSKTRIMGSAYMMAASRKRVIGEACGNPPHEERMAGTIAAHTIAMVGGADILRVHDVVEAVQAAKVADAILKYRSDFLDKLYIKGLRIYAYHGVNKEEKLEGQPFVLDIQIKADLSKAKEDDAIESTVSYAAVRKTVERVFTAKSYDLIERVAKVVCNAVLEEYAKVKEIRLRIKKPEAPMNAVFDYAAVEITEKRKSVCH